MANIKSQKKRILTAEKARQRNKAVRSELKTAIKAVHSAIEAGKLVYYSDDGVTATAGSNPRVGYTVAKALAGDSIARVRLG